MSLTLTQEEAASLMALEKHYIGSDPFNYPGLGGSLRIPLFSEDHREEFSLDISRSRVLLEKNSLQKRARKAVTLARLDFGGAPHRNPDDVEIACPHLHLYREGYGDKWAVPLPSQFSGIHQPGLLLDAFMVYCSVITKPVIREDMFT